MIPSELGTGICSPARGIYEVHLDVGTCLFSGTIPSEIGSLTSLTHLDLDNFLELPSTIPSELGQLVTLGKYIRFDDDYDV
jgi:hypothetical protein